VGFTMPHRAGRRKARTTIRHGLFLVVALLVVLIGSAVATVSLIYFERTTTQTASGLNVYDYATGTLKTSDVLADWNLGTYANTAATPDGGSVMLARFGDVGPNVSTNPWWDLTWKTRRCFSITNANTWPVANLPVTLTFDSTNDWTKGWLLANGDDIRALTGGASPTAVPFFVDTTTINTAATAVTVTVASLSASASTTVCLYSNKAGVSALSDANAKLNPPLYRIAAGISVIQAPLNWSSDTSLPAGATMTFPGGGAANLTTVSPATSTFAVTTPAMPAATPLAVFSNVRWPGIAGSVQYAFTVANGRPIQARGYFAESCCAGRVFNFRINSTVVVTNFDVWSTCPSTSRSCGVFKSLDAVSTGTVTLIAERVALSGSYTNNNPIINAAEIVDKSVLSVGSTRREGLLSNAGTWTSPVYNTGSTTTVYGLVKASLSGASLAVGQGVTASSVAAASAATFGNDGVRNGTFYTSNSGLIVAGAGQWWNVDLGSSQAISKVNVFTSSYAMYDMTVLVSNSPFTGFTTPAAAAASAGVTSVSFAGGIQTTTMNSTFPSGTSGRYVRLWSSSANSISFGEVEVVPPTYSGVNLQVAYSDSATGPWAYVGPDNTSATSYTDRSAIPYAFDSHQYYRVQGNFSSSSLIASPLLDSVVSNAGLTAMTRQADGYHQYGAPDTADNWLVRIKTALPVTVGKSATLTQLNPTGLAFEQISGYLDRTSAQCCVANAPFFTTTATATSQTPVPLYDVGGARSLSVVLTRHNDQPGLMEVVVDIALSTTVHVQIPLRRTTLIQNMAVGKTSNQSTTDYGGVAAYANDGNTSGIYTNSSVNHAALEAFPWWQVDIGSIRSITSINVWPRTDCCTGRLTNFTVIISPTPIVASTIAGAVAGVGAVSVSYTNTAGFPTMQSFTVPAGTTGRYVRIWADNSNTALHASGKDYFHIAELQVMGPT
jgi:F5/8 type C domain